jgi:hypothetical protein
MPVSEKPVFFAQHMYTKEEKKALVKSFWIHFDNYCNLQPELSWKKKKWVLHRTGIKNIDLKFEAGRKHVAVMLELNHKNEDQRLEYYERLLQYRVILEQGLELAYTRPMGEEVSRIFTSLRGVDIHRQSDWHAMFQFMAEKMTLLQHNFLEIADFIEDENMHT